jgi:hypothetical protein
METPNPAPSGSAGAPIEPLRGNLAQAVRFWEPLRIAYNLLLVGVVVLWVVLTWPHFREALRFSSLLPLSFLALVANVFYCAAYLVELPFQQSARNFLRRERWILWTAGTLFAILLANYWIADEIFPDFR